jgi:hypothetical protein
MMSRDDLELLETVEDFDAFGPVGEDGAAASGPSHFFVISRDGNPDRKLAEDRGLHGDGSEGDVQCGVMLEDGRYARREELDPVPSSDVESPMPAASRVVAQGLDQIEKGRMRAPVDTTFGQIETTTLAVAGTALGAAFRDAVGTNVDSSPDPEAVWSCPRIVKST